jgi:hypothetical protein
MALNAIGNTCMEACGQGAACGGSEPERPPFEEQVQGRPVPQGGDLDDPYGPPVFCRQKTLPGNVYRLSCADGTLAEAIDRVPPYPERKEQAPQTPTYPETVVVRTLADIIPLAGRRAITGDLRIESPELLRLQLPSLRTVTGDLTLQENPRLLRAELFALVRVGGEVVVQRNAALTAAPFARLRDVGGQIFVAENPALPTGVTKALLSLQPAPPPLTGP